MPAPTLRKRWTTWLLSALLVLLASYVRCNVGPASQFERLVETTIHVQDGNLSKAGEGSERQQVIENAAAAYRSTLAYLDRQPKNEEHDWARATLLARLSIVLLEGNQIEAAGAVLKDLERGAGGARACADVLRYTYGHPDATVTVADEKFAHTRAVLLSRNISAGWTWWRLEKHFLVARGNISLAHTIEADLEVASLRRRTCASIAHLLRYTFLLAGLACIIAGLFRRRSPKCDDVVNRWSLFDGWTAVVCSTTVLLLIGGGATRTMAYLRIGPLLLPQLLSYVGFVLTVNYVLLRPAGLTFAEAFGLRLRSRLGSIVGAALALSAIDYSLYLLMCAAVSQWGTAGYAEPNSEWLRTLASGDRLKLVSAVARTVILTPFCEEVLVRGLIYGTLRLRHAPWIAAALSAAPFAFVHFYDGFGTALVFTSAIAYSIVYERTRSLMPCIAAHASWNGLNLVEQWLRYS